MATVDSLDIKISASAKTATTAIDNLVEKLETLSASIGTIDGSRLSGLSNGVQKLGNAVRTLNGVKAGDYTRIANGLKKFAEIDTSRLSQTSSALSGLSRGLSAMGSVQNLQNITPAVNALKNLAKVNMAGFDTTKLASIATTLSALGTSLAGVGKIEASTVRLVSAMARLSSSGQYISNVTVEFPKIGKAVVKFVTDIQKAGTVDTNITKLVDGIARLASAGKRVRETTQHLKSLGDAVMNLLNRLQHAPAINTNIANTIQGLGNLAVSGGRASLASSNLGAGASRLGNALKSLTGRMSSANIGVKSLINGFGALYIKFQLAKRAVMGFGKIVKSSMDYIEDLNYFNAAFGQVAEKADLKSFRKMGYESAEEYYNSFSQRAEQLTQKMSGFKINEKGMAISTSKKSMGINPSLVMNYQAMFAQMSSSMGVASEMSMKLSETLTKLGADLASVKNLSFKDTWENMASGITGMSRAVDKFGINIRNMNLQQQLSNIGIDKSITKLNQQEKALVRTIIMLDSTRYAWADMSKTIQQPANQLRLLQSSWSNLSRTIGNIFLPIVAKVLPYLNALTIVLQRFAEQIVKILGFEDFDLGGLGATGGADFDFSDLADDTDSAADNMDKVAKKAKKASDNLQGFDIINKLQANDTDKDSGKDKTKGLNPSELGKLSGALDKLIEEYNKKWNEAFKNMQNKANELATKMQKALVDAWNKGDFSELGAKVAAWINKGLAKIPWDRIKETTKKTARSIATFLNGFIAKLDWELIGKTFAEGLNAIIIGGYEFWTTFDWLKFGTSLATGVNSFIQNFDAEKFGKLLGAKLRGVIQFAFGFITNLNFADLGKKFGDSINGFFEYMGEVRENTGLTGWQELGKTISKSIMGILETINTALSAVKWEEVGKAIGQFIGSIDWFGVIGSVGKAIVNALWASVKVAMSAIAEDPVGIAKAVISVLGAVFAYKKLAALISPLKGNVGLILSTAIKESKIAGAVSKLGGIFGSTLKNTIMSSGIAKTIISVFSSVTSKISAIGTTIGTKLMSAASAVLSNPVTGLVAIAAAAAVGAGLVIADRLKEAIDAVNFTGDYELKVPEGFTKAAEKAKESLNNTLSEAKKVSETIKGINESVKTTDGKNIDDLASRYYKLSQKANPTASDIAVLKKYSEELSDKIPGFAKNVDKQTGAFKGSKEELNALVSSTQRAARAQAAYNAAVELYEKQQENKKNIEEKQKVLDQYEKEYEEIKKITEEVKRQHGVESEVYKAQLRNQGTYADKVNSARAEVDALKKSQKDIAKQIKQNNKIMENAKVSTKKYAEANKTLNEKMEKLNVSSKSQKDVVKKLNEMVDEGEISWKDYKKIVDGNYASVDELNGAISKLSPKSVEIKAETKGKEDIKDLQDEVNGVSGKNVEIGVNLGSDTGATINRFKEMTDGVPSEKITTFKAKLDDAQIKKVKDTFKKALKAGAIQIPIQYAITESQKKILDKLKPGGNNPMFANALKASGLDKFNEALEKFPVIKGYALGGFPEDGWFRASHGEIMGKFDNGQSVVANNEQITEAFARSLTNSLAPAIYAAVKQAGMETSQQNGGGDIYIDGKKVTESVIGHINQISQSRGRSPIWGMT